MYLALFLAAYSFSRPVARTKRHVYAMVCYCLNIWLAAISIYHLPLVRHVVGFDLQAPVSLFLPLFAMVTSGGPYTEFVEALNDVSGARGAGYYFFVSFYVVGVLIFFNVFSAFVIDAFLSQYTEARALAHDDEADTLDQSCVEEGYRIVATRRSAQNDVYRAMFLEDDDGDDDDDDECGVIN